MICLQLSCRLIFLTTFFRAAIPRSPFQECHLEVVAPHTHKCYKGDSCFCSCESSNIYCCFYFPHIYSIPVTMKCLHYLKDWYKLIPFIQRWGVDILANFAFLLLLTTDKSPPGIQHIFSLRLPSVRIHIFIHF